ncbi:hypothetical protein HDU79_002957 [Rhizoclosmatium sp. JEL0117]|nr:hypothetical protein HDU79_002957 [Rhizoclosmatium sp. JEL0117]
MTASRQTPSSGPSESSTPILDSVTNTTASKVTVKKKDDENADEGSDGEYSDYEYDEDPNKVYCYCRKTYDPSLFYIQCDGCDEWFHGICANMKEEEAERIFLWFCRICEHDSGRRPVFKKFCAAWQAGEAGRLQTAVVHQHQIIFDQLQEQFQLEQDKIMKDKLIAPPAEGCENAIADSPESPPLEPSDSPDSPPPMSLDPCSTPGDEEEVFIDIEAVDDQESVVIDVEAISTATVSPQFKTAPQTPQSAAVAPPSAPQFQPAQVLPEIPPTQPANAQPETTTLLFHQTQTLHTLKTHLSTLYVTPPTCQKYLPDPTPPNLLNNQRPVPHPSQKPPPPQQDMSSRYCSQTCGLSISAYALKTAIHNKKIPKRTYTDPRLRVLRDRGDLVSLETFDALDAEKLRTLGGEKGGVKTRVLVWERVLKGIDACVFRKKVVEGCLFVEEGGVEEKENVEGVVEEKKRVKGKKGKKKRRVTVSAGGGGGEDGGEDVAVEDVGVFVRKPVCGFDSRIVDVWLKAGDAGVFIEGDLVPEQDLVEESEDEDAGDEWEDLRDLDGLDLEGLSTATSWEDVKVALLPTMCAIPSDECKQHASWERLKVEEAEFHIETLMEKMKEIVEEEGQIVERMKKRRILMTLSL